MYEYKVKGLYKVTAEEAGTELERISAKYGKLSPELVVEESKDENSILHSVFEWDDERAAQRFRLEQARKLIGNLTVIITTEKVEANVRAFVNVRPSEKLPRTYMPMTEAILNDTAYQDLLQQAKLDAETFNAKYAQIVEVNAIKVENLKFINSIQ